MPSPPPQAFQTFTSNSTSLISGETLLRKAAPLWPRECRILVFLVDTVMRSILLNRDVWMHYLTRTGSSDRHLEVNDEHQLLFDETAPFIFSSLSFFHHFTSQRNEIKLPSPRQQGLRDAHFTLCVCVGGGSMLQCWVYNSDLKKYED